jgi:nuclear protein NHN1
VRNYAQTFEIFGSFQLFFFFSQATPPFERLPRERPRFEFSPPPQKYPRVAAGHFEEDPYGRVPRYRELPAHRMPHYEDDDLNKRRVRSTREVIVEKADEWSDPWARKTSRRGSAGRENRGRGGRERSYSSNSSYSTSSGTSRSRSSSESSGSPSAARRKRFDSQRSKERVSSKKPVRAKSGSLSKRGHSPPGKLSKKF